jgi:L-lactate utilization protein LutB
VQQKKTIKVQQKKRNVWYCLSSCKKGEKQSKRMKSNCIKDDVLQLKELKLHMYSMGASVKADWYAKTTKEIAEYVGRIYGHDMKMLVLKGQETVPQEPEYPETTNKKDKAIWSKKYDQYLKHEQ